MGPTLGRDDVELIQRDTLYQGFSPRSTGVAPPAV